MRLIKRFKFIFFGLLIVFGVINSSCSSDGDNENSEKRLLLKSLKKNDVTYREYIYNSDNNIKTIQWFNNEGETQSKLKFTYIADTIQRIWTYSDGSTIYRIGKYFRQNENSIKKERYFADGTLDKYRFYNNPNNSCSHTEIVYYNADHSYDGKSIIEYLDEKCSFFEKDYNELDELYGSVEYLRDDKMSAYLSSRMIVFGTENNHNTIACNRWDNDGNIVESSSYTSSYNYNSDNYPTTETRTHLDGVIDVYKFEYY